jgi:hypothetical protein
MRLRIEVRPSLVVVALRHLALQLEELTRLGHLQEDPADAAFREFLD